MRYLSFYLTAFGLSALMSGCSMTPEYGCHAPDGVTCMSASEVYDRDGSGEVIRPKIEQSEGEQEEAQGLPHTPTGFTGLFSPAPGDPIFREPRRLRVWVVDWVDTLGVYHPNHHLYMRVDEGDWLLPAMRARLQEESDEHPE
jgi:hypothetical protein